MADLAETNMTGANLRNALIVGANFTNAIIVDTRFGEADISNAIIDREVSKRLMGTG